MRVGVIGRLGVFSLFALAMTACSPQEPSCAEPVPPAPVDGATASEQQMVDAHDAVVRFQKFADDYQLCLVAAKVDHQKNPPFYASFHDDGFEAEMTKRTKENQKVKERVVANFNTAARTYNEAHP